MEGIKKQLMDRIASWERGRIFFPVDFASFESQGMVRMALSGLVDDGIIVRLARGVYCYPRIEGEYSMGMILPDPETIALAVAAKRRMRIAEYGDRAAWELGLSGARVSDYMYLTDGAPARICLSGNRRIVFNHTSEVRIFDYRSDLLRKIVSAVRFLGEDAINEDRRRILSMRLREVAEEEFASDIAIPPAWVQKLLKELRDR